MASAHDFSAYGGQMRVLDLLELLEVRICQARILGIEFWTFAREVYTFHLSVISPVPSREDSELIYLDLTILILHHYTEEREGLATAVIKQLFKNVCSYVEFQKTNFTQEFNKRHNLNES